MPTKNLAVIEQRVAQIGHEDESLAALVEQAEAYWTQLEVAVSRNDEEETQYYSEQLIGVGADIAAKADACYRFDKICDIEASRNKAEGQAYYNKSAQWLRKRERFREYLRWLLLRIGQTKLEGNVHDISLVPANEPTTPDIYDAKQLPPKYLNQVISWEPDEAAIMADLKADIEIPGARLQKGKGKTVRLT